MSTIYEITVRRAGLPPQIKTVGEKPLHFGSGKKADLILVGENIPEVAGRLFVSSGDKILLFNLGSQMTLDGLEVPVHDPTIWNPGARLQLGTYALELKTVDIPLPQPMSEETPVELAPLSANGHSPRPAPVAISRPPDVVPEVGTFVKSPAAKPIASQPAIEAVQETIKEKSGFRGFDDSKPKDPEDTDWRVNSRDEHQTQLASPIIENDKSEDIENATRVKIWVDQDKLSVQLGLKTINFAPGERIMLPLSVQNNYSHPLELVVSAEGLPSDWTIADSPNISLAAGEIKTFEVVILTRMTAISNRLDVFLNLIDRTTPQINAHISLPITLKSQPDLTGDFDQRRTKVPGKVYLTLQNQTLSSEKIRLSIGNHDNALRVLLSNAEVELAPYQKIRIPITVDVIKAPYFASHDYTLHISAQQGTRAPLDLATVVSVSPSPTRYLLYLLFIIAALLAVSLLVIPRIHSVLSLLATSTPTLTLTLTPMPTTAPVATVTDIPIPTSVPQAVVAPPTAIPTPTNTPVPFADPRSEDCQASSPIPSGWVLYIVKRGENLYRIAKNHGTTDDELARVNCIPNKKIISQGQRIVVPSSP